MFKSPTCQETGNKRHAKCYQHSLNKLVVQTWQVREGGVSFLSCFGTTSHLMGGL